MTITWSTEVNAPCCPGEILPPNKAPGEGLLIQTDWDYPKVAQDFGWSLRSVQRKTCLECGQKIKWQESVADGSLSCGLCDCGDYDPCDHDGTDGTVDCKECGVTASQCIEAAGNWLRDNDGATASDPGYFTES